MWFTWQSTYVLEIFTIPHLCFMKLYVPIIYPSQLYNQLFHTFIHYYFNKACYWMNYLLIVPLKGYTNLSHTMTQLIKLKNYRFSVYSFNKEKEKKKTNYDLIVSVLIQWKESKDILILYIYLLFEKDTLIRVHKNLK